MIRPLRCLFLALLLCLPALSEPGGISAAAWSADGKHLVTIGSKRRLRVHQGDTGKIVKAITVPGEATTLISFSPDSGSQEENRLTQLCLSGDRVVTVGLDHNLHWWSLPGLQPLAQSSATYGVVGLSMGGEITAYTATSSRYLDAEISWVRLSKGKQEGSMLPNLPPPDSSSSFGGPTVSPDGCWVMAMTAGEPTLWDMTNEEITTSVLDAKAHLGPWALGSQRFYTSRADGVRGYLYENPTAESLYIGCKDPRALMVTSDESRLVVQTRSGLSIYDLSSGTKLLGWGRPDQPPLTVSGDAKFGFVLTEKTLEVWEISTQRCLYRLPARSKSL